MASDPNVLTAEDRALLERVAVRIVELHLEVPAILTLETSKPLSLLASSTLTFFEPIVQALFPFPSYRRFAVLVEKREALETLARLIEDGADRAHRDKRQAADARRAARRTPGGTP